MNRKIKKYVDSLFENAPRTRRMYELKEEILANLNDKYNDFLDKGMDENTAYNGAISNMDNILDRFSSTRNYKGILRYEGSIVKNPTNTIIIDSNIGNVRIDNK